MYPFIYIRNLWQRTSVQRCLEGISVIMNCHRRLAKRLWRPATHGAHIYRANISQTNISNPLWLVRVRRATVWAAYWLRASMTSVQCYDWFIRYSGLFKFECCEIKWCLLTQDESYIGSESCNCLSLPFVDCIK